MRRIVFIFLFLSGTAFAGTEASSAQNPGSLIMELHAAQNGNGNFKKGIFPSYRVHPILHYRKEDYNIFFSAIIGLRLMRLENKIPASHKKYTDEILENIRNASKDYENKYGRISYNFWETKPVNQFPNDAYLSKAGRFHIPDDADDSVLLFYLNGASKSKLDSLRQMMVENVPGKKRKIGNTLPLFKKLPAYSTWLGDRMPPEFDFCVLANVLYVFNAYGLEPNKHDSASYQFLRTSFERGFLNGKSQRISPQYKTESACLYHLSFLISADARSPLSDLKPALSARLREKLKHTPNRNEALLLCNALLYMDETLPANYRLPETRLVYPFFFANMASVSPNPFNSLLTNTPLLQFNYECKAWETMQELEFMLLTH